MQANLGRGKPAFSMPSLGRSVAVLVGAPLIATIAFCAPALAACGVSHPAGVHAASTGVSGVHASTSRTAATSTGSGGSGTLGCRKRIQRHRVARPAGRQLGPGDRDGRPYRARGDDV